MKRVLVTGGSRGLGLGICQRLIDEGYYVITCSRRVSPELAILLKNKPSSLEHHIADLSRPESVVELARQSRLLDGISGFVSNAGLGTEGLLSLTSETAIRECVEVNMIAPILLAREVIKGMLTQGGSLIFISSVAARTGFAGLSIYGATKAGLVAFSRSVAREYGERGIRSNCILPGFLKTEMTQALGQQDQARLVRRTPLSRLGQVEDVLGAVRFLLCEDARFVTGTELVVDGGMLA